MSPDRVSPAGSLVETALGHRLTLVIAAPGWGKSTLLRRLAASTPAIEVARPPAGWTPYSLARQVLGEIALHAPFPPSSDSPAPDSSSADLPASASPDSPDNPDQTTALAATVGSAATQIGHDVLIVIDDVDSAPDHPLVAFLEAMVLHLPPKAHLVLAARRAPALRLARLRAAGAVAVVTSTDLAITAEELGDLGLDDAATATVAEIVRATGGWPLAVQLAAEALRRTGPLDRSALVDRLLAPDAVLFEYLAQEVLAGLPVADRELLALAGHVPCLSVGLLQALGRDDLVAALAPLGEGGVFLERDTAAPSRYRASLLGGEFVRRALAPPEPALLARAVDAYVGDADLQSAFLLCTSLGDAALAARVIDTVERPDRLTPPDALAGALALAATGGDNAHIAELQGDLCYRRGEWDQALSDYGRARRLGDTASPRLARKQGVILYLRGRLDEAEEVCREARLDGGAPGEEAQVMAWRAAIRWLHGDVEGCQELLVPAEAAARRSGDDAALATVHTTLAMLAAMRGDRRSNARSYMRALGHAERAGDVVQIVRIRTNRGSHYTEEGSYEAALVELAAAIEVAELIGSETFSALAYFNRGDTYMRMGRLDDALRDVRRAQDIWDRIGSEMADYATGLLGEVQLRRGQRTEALALFTQALTWAERRGDVQAIVPALIGTAKVLMVDDPEAAAAAADRAIAQQLAVWQPHALLASGWVERHRGRRDLAGRRAAEALRLAHAQQDRPAVAEALLLQAAIERPPSTALAAEASRLWHDLGDPIGQARCALVAAEAASGAARSELVARAEQLLFDTGAWGYLADARRAIETASTPSSAIAISTLAGFRIARDGTPVEVGEWGSRKARDFVKLLVARRGAPVVRDEAAAILWPGEADRSARRLSVLLSTIRSVFDPLKACPPDHFVAADHDTVWLVREHVEVDVELFLREAADGRRLVAMGETDKGEAALARAAARYLGDFCADDPYADWAAGMRQLARHTFVDCAAQLGRLADGRAEHGEGVRHRLRILDVDPYDESAHHELIRALALQRRHGEARRAYRTYCTRLAELDLDPMPFAELVR